MLQQTRAEVVAPYFERWMASFPNLQALARASEDDVLKIWQGLGYYSRARRLQSGARYLLENCDGALPRTPEELLKVPGIGPYSAGAISSIAYQERFPLVDGNVVRVLSRFFGLRGDPTRAPLKNQLWELADLLVPELRPGDFNQALMELGALLCSPKKPTCVICPWQKDCIALREGLTEELPKLPKRAAPTALSMVVVLLNHRGRYAVQKLPPTARWWAGLDAFPFADLPSGADAPDAVVQEALKLAGSHVVRSAELGSTLVHAVTRFRIRLIPCLICIQERGETKDGLRWLPRSQLAQLSLPAPHRRILAALRS